MFIRTKLIKGQKYAYLVENSWQGGGARQKVAKYLGKVIRIEPKKELDFHETAGVGQEYFEKAMAGIFLDIVRWELLQHGFEEQKNGIFSLENLNVDLNSKTVTKTVRKSKPAVIGMGQGFLCDHTINALLNYDGSRDYQGFLLAEALLAAGLNIDKDFFVDLFRKVKEDFKIAEMKEMKEKIRYFEY